MEDTPRAVVHRLAGEQALDRGHRLLDPRALEQSSAANGVDHDAFIEAVRVLGDDGTVNVRFFGPSLVNILRITVPGLLRHLETTRSDLGQVREAVAAAVRAQAAEGRLGEAVDLPALLGEPYLLVETLLDERRDRGELVYTPLPGGRVRLHRVGAPPLRAP